MVTEKRKRKRKNEISEVKLMVGHEKNSSGSNNAVRALALDLSLDGLKLIAQKTVAVESPVKVEFVLPGTSKRILTSGKVRWAKTVDHEKKCEMGIEFVDVSPETFYALLGHIYKKE